MFQLLTQQLSRSLEHDKEALARIIREVEGAKSLLCYKHVVMTVFGATKEASA